MLPPPVHLEYKRLPDLPVAVGLAGLFGGVSHGVVLIAGGSNFPDKAPWYGGTKTYYRDIYALRPRSQSWKKIGLLPFPRGYGVSVTYHNKVICVAGSDAAQFHSQVFSLELKGQRIVTKSLPPLPIYISLGFGDLIGDELIVGGGQQDSTGNSSNQFFALRLSSAHPSWRTLPSPPGPGRILAACGTYHSSLWVCGGASFSELKQRRTYLTDAYQFDFKHGWRQIADLPHKTLGAPFLDGVILGGDDGSKLGFKPWENHPGFSRWVQGYRDGRWTERDDLPFSAVLMPAIKWHGGWVLPGGESIPGVRTRQVWQVKIKR